MQRRTFLNSMAAQVAAVDYKLGPGSQRQDGVPAGRVTQYKFTSTIFPGTERDYWVYVPAQYDGSRPACVMVIQDGGGWVKEDGAIRATVVMDNLIHVREMPVTIGIFINPGVLPALGSETQHRYNRSFEYDAMGDRYARFLIEEMLPEVGKSYKLSSDPNDRAIGGSSSGASCAFTAAWNRPDQFRRVLSWIGSYTNLRGAEIYPNLIRKTEPKPLRIFLQDGKNDLNIYAGSWFLANQAMASALEFAGYDYKFVVGEEAHNSKHGAAILPDALRWLWRDYPRPIARSVGAGGERQFVRDILVPGSDWEQVTSGAPVAAAGGGSATGYSADRSLMLVANPQDRWVWSYQVQRDGTPANGEPFYRLETPDDSAGSGATSIATDTEGYIWVATRIGIQVCDQAGRVTAIVNPPDATPLNAVAFGEADLDWLYCMSGTRWFRRRTRRKGTGGKAVKPPQPRL